MNSAPKFTRGLLVAAAALALILTLAGWAGMAGYAVHGDALLVQGDSRVSRLFVGEAERAERAGDDEAALALYGKAFAAGFAHRPDKARALTLQGRLLWRLGRVRDAADVLSEAAAGSAPNFDGAAILVEALLQLRRVDEAQSVVRRWRERSEKTAPPQSRAEMLYAAGRVAQERGDLKQARAAYEESAVLSPGGVADYRLGQISAGAGDAAQARRRLLAFLLGGASGTDANKARQLLGTLATAP